MESLSLICVFSGRQKANDVLVSHDHFFFERQTKLAVEGSLFIIIVGVAAYVGWRSLVMLRPFIEQVI